MGQRTGLAVVATVGLVAAWVGWGAYARRSVAVVPYTTVETVDGVEIRAYPASVVVETTAPTEDEAYARLERYRSGANEPRADVPMATPVSTHVGVREREGRVLAPIRVGGEAVASTVPVRSTTADDRVTVGITLPEGYTVERAPRPTNAEVTVRADPPRTLAVRPFSWWATDDRTESQEAALLSALDGTGLEQTGAPVLFRYDPPLTPPFLRQNEVAVAVDVPG
ncbi:SOUL family heme-binding protein [Halomarina rubra]|uniref:SOUL family heme-binding protein n=1 Tax=Halomarina rubra TaxID=2071873 RepID=A0ABD6AR50_9EURY|nr:heme-binding protein [Halomarina rubra]